MRNDLSILENWINPSSHVLDCGCGDGELLQDLIEKKSVFAYGIEKEIDNVKNCIKNGVQVIQQDLEGGLALFDDKFFDVVILSQTLQTIHNTQHILQEVVRVGKKAIITFPNFGYWKHRLKVASGRMPVSKTLPYEWYNTPNVRVLTLSDFEILSHKAGLKVLDRIVLHENEKITWGHNWRGSLVMYLVTGV
jgi:methionine biosynthesis protein MetW